MTECSPPSPVAPETRSEMIRFCSLISEASGEDPAGSAWATSRYLLVELPLPWSYDVLTGAHMPTGLRDLVADLYAADDDWGLIGMAPDAGYSVTGFTRVIDLRLPQPPFRGYARSEFLIPSDDLVPVLRMLADDPATPALDLFRQPESGLRDLLVCTHGAVDACCAKFGYPIYRRLRQIAAEAANSTRVWRCTHFGGHRFAATLLDMPEGRYWGRLQARHLPHLVRRDVPASDLRGCYRGWAALPHPLQQIAEAEVLTRAGWAWTECRITPGEAPALDAGSVEVAFAYTHAMRGERGEIVVSVNRNGTAMTQHSTVDATLVEAPQYRTAIQWATPMGGLFGAEPNGDG